LVQNELILPWQGVALVFDLNDNKEYAMLVDGLRCDVRGKGCTSEAEWRELIKPYMEE
jgi:hypothetical protein